MRERKPKNLPYPAARLVDGLWTAYPSAVPAGQFVVEMADYCASRIVDAMPEEPHQLEKLEALIASEMRWYGANLLDCIKAEEGRIRRVGRVTSVDESLEAIIFMGAQACQHTIYLKDAHHSGECPLCEVSLEVHFRRPGRTEECALGVVGCVVRSAPTPKHEEDHEG